MGKKKKVDKWASYPPNWKEIVFQVRLRSLCRCERCGVKDKAFGYRDRSGKFFDITDNAYSVVNKNGRGMKWYVNGVQLWDFLPNGFQLIRIILTTAHLDHDPENWEVSLDRLQYLCQRCHLNNDRRHNINKKRFGKGYNKQPKLF